MKSYIISGFIFMLILEVKKVIYILGFF